MHFSPNYPEMENKTVNSGESDRVKVALMHATMTR